MAGEGDRYPRPPLLQTALRTRCPRCGQGPLFGGLLSFRPCCPVCGLDYNAAEPGDGGAAFVILILGAAVTLGAFLLQIAFHPPMWVHLAIWTPTTLIGAIWLLRPIKAALVYQQYWTSNFLPDGEDGPPPLPPTDYLSQSSDNIPKP